MTKQRTVILEEVRTSTNHPTADEVYRIVRKKLPHISMGTVYRNLEVLERMGLIRSLHSGPRSMRFDGTLEPHYHIRCRSCGRLEDVFDLELDNVVRKAARESGYDVSECTLELLGTCPACRGRAGSDARS